MWALDPDVRHLNHGSFGAVPIEILELQSEWRRRWEANPTAFVMNDLQPAVDRARSAVASLIGADPSNLALVRNASTGVASVLRSIEADLGPGDELLTTAQDYNAIRQMMEDTAGRTGASVVVAPVPFPVDGPSQVIDAVVDVVSERTRLAVIDHITSPTAVVFPIDDIVSRLEPDVPVLVDGAHGAGQVMLDVENLGASWYTGNLHKWTCAPKGAAFLHARSDRRAATVPTVISHGRNAPLGENDDRFQLLFDWLGTDDFSQWLVLPETLDLVGGLEPGGWPALIKRNHELVLAGREVICAAVGTDPPVPGSMVGTMAAIRLPDATGPTVEGELSPVMGELVEAGFETLAMNWPHWPSQVLRVSAHHYNRIEEYEDLAAVLRSKMSN